MRRWISRLAVGTAAAALALSPALASADPATEPVAFGFGLFGAHEGEFGDEGKPTAAGFVDYPEAPGTAKDDKTERSLPEKVVKPNRLQAKVSAYSLEVAHGEDEVPSAKAAGDFTLHAAADDTDQAAARGNQGPAVSLRGVKNSVNCASRDKLTSNTDAAGAELRIRGEQTPKTIAHLPAHAVTVENVDAGVPGKFNKDAFKDWRTDVTIVRVEQVSDLQAEVKAKLAGKASEVGAQLTTKPGTVADAGWAIVITDFGLKKDDGAEELLNTSAVVVGALTCAIPENFVPKPVTQPQNPAPQPAVPVKIAAGDGSTTGGSGSSLPFVLGGGAVVLAAGAAGAFLVSRRRRTAQASTED